MYFKCSQNAPESTYKKNFLGEHATKPPYQTRGSRRSVENFGFFNLNLIPCLSYAAPVEWNKLDVKLDHSLILETFKKKVKTYLFNIAFT